MELHRWTLLLLAVMIGGGQAMALAEDTSYEEDGYAFYDIWWREYRSAPDTALLLHFNKPAEHAWTLPGNAKLIAGGKARQPDQLKALAKDLGGDLGDFGEEPGMGGGMGGGMDDVGKGFLDAQKEKEQRKRGRSRDAEAPDGRVFDYSPNLQAIDLPDGASKVNNGRIGKALKLTGTTGLGTFIGNRGETAVMEGWFKVDALPDEAVCLLASGGNGGRLMLQPDGHVTLNWQSQTAGKRLTLRSNEPIEADRWHHIAAYGFKLKHIEGSRGKHHEIRLGIDGRVAASYPHRRNDSPEPFINRGPFHIGQNPDGGQVYTGLVDQVRVAGRRRYNQRPPMPWRDAEAQRPIPFGPPHFAEDSRVVHASFESRDLTVSPDNRKQIDWNLGKHAAFEDVQVPGPYGQGVLIDPALGFPRIPIEGMSIEEGTFELWFQPVNWDNHTDFAKINWSKHTMSVARFMGRDKQTGKIVAFMTLTLARAAIHGERQWLHPGQWTHLIWTWSPQDVHEQDGWGSTKAGDPISTFRAVRFGNQFWRAMLTRNTELIGRVEPLYVEIGIDDNITVYHDQRPAIMVDEVIGHSRRFSEEELRKAPLRWMNQLPAPSADQ